MILQVDPDKCTGCMACEVFCSLEQEGSINPVLARVHVHEDERHNVFLPILCPPCDNAACIAACPEPGAIARSPATGAVVIQEHLCTGCSKCIRACDIGAIRLLRQNGRGKFGKAVAIKCNQCGGNPWCVRVCEPGALRFADASPAVNGNAVFRRLYSARTSAEEFLVDGKSWQRVKVK